MGHGYLFLSTLVTLWVILDPPGLLPVFIGLTKSMTKKERSQAALRASLVALGVIGVFAVFGQQILTYLHISIEALEVSGGLLLLLVALQLLMGEQDEVDESKSSTVNVAIVPLGTPLLGGPGVIVAMMVAVQGVSGVDYLVVGASLIVAMVAVYLFLRFASGIHRVLKDAGTILLTRIAGVLLAAIAVQMMADGVLGFLK
ncbi:MAG: MarC family protein [Propionibacteriaceae bacterium]|jgi:multiple antibiotic resistance protein|nr:MarC family protein [Propionibacteriaceae bacterium]